jgi:hypothetical protein
MGQAQSGEKLPCEEERSEWAVANKRYSIKAGKYNEITEGENAVKDLRELEILRKEVVQLKKEADAKFEKWTECMQQNATGEV